MARGEQFVIIVGTSEKLVLFADSLALLMLKQFYLTVMFLTGVDPFGLMAFIVMAMNHHYFLVNITLWEVLLVSVIIVRMLVFVAWKVIKERKDFNITLVFVSCLVFRFYSMNMTSTLFSFQIL